MLWLLALLCLFLVLTCAVWLFATPIEETTTVVGADGRVVRRDSETDLGPVILPALFLAGSLVCLGVSIVGVVKASRRRSRVSV